ncbi:MAG: hypothetical protein Q7S76_02385 [bacterium]|nr:hypothetical protein [bacterium]
MRRHVFSFLCVAFLLFSLFPTLYELGNQAALRPNRAFELVHNFPTDYNFYLSRIRQGIEGRTTVVEKYTSELHEGSAIHGFYLLLGRVGQWVRVPWGRSGDVYHVARIVFGFALLSLIIEFARHSFQRFSWQVIAFILAVTASSWPKLVWVEGVPRFGGYMPWWSVMDSLQRITFIPHLLVGQGLLLFLIMAGSNETVLRRPGNWIYLGFLGFLLGMVFPPGFIFVGVTYGVVILLEVLFVNGAKTMRSYFSMIVPRLVIMSMGLPALLYLFLMTSFYPWKRLAEQDILHPLTFQYGEYFLAVGPILPIGLAGLFLALLFRERRMFAAAAWVISWLVLLFIFQFIPAQSPLRFSEMIPHVPLGVLTAYLFMQALSVCKKRFPHSVVSLFAFRLPAQAGFPLSVLILLGFSTMASSYLWQKDFIDHKIRAEFPLVPTGSYVMYPLKDFIAGIQKLQDLSPRDMVILSETTAGNYMPVHSGNTVYVGHDNTVASEVKKELVAQFFRGQMNQDEAYEWLRINRIGFIFFGPQEKEDGGIQDLRELYSFLEEAYKNGYVTLYRVSL